MPYLTSFSDLELVLDTLSGDDAAAWLHSPLHSTRAERAVALAFVLGHYDRLDQLIAVKARFLEDRQDHGATEFLAFAREIKRRAVIASTH